MTSNPPLLQGTTYYYRIFASNTAGEGASSDVAFEMAITKPSPVLDTTVLIIGELALKISWAPPADTGNGGSASSARPILGYTLYVDSVTSGIVIPAVPVRFSIAQAPGATTFTALSPVMQQGVRYEVFLVAHNSAGNSSAPIKANETAILKPAPPVATATVPSNPGEIRFAWNKPVDTGATGRHWPLLTFEVHMAQSASFALFVTVFAGATLNGVPINSMDAYTLVNTGLTIGQTYYFRVLATNQAGQSPFSGVLEQICISLPGYPANLRVAVTAPLEITVQFDKPQDTGTGGQSHPIDRFPNPKP